MADKRIRWAADLAGSDYQAAATYLSLLLDPARVEKVARRLTATPLVTHRANDLLRASGLGLLPENDPEVAKDLKKIRKGQKLSPVLLVRGELGRTPVTVADGYHRICASYHVDEDAGIPCRIVDLTGIEGDQPDAAAGAAGNGWMPMSAEVNSGR